MTVNGKCATSVDLSAVEWPASSEDEIKFLINKVEFTQKLAVGQLVAGWKMAHNGELVLQRVAVGSWELVVDCCIHEPVVRNKLDARLLAHDGEENHRPRRSRLHRFEDAPKAARILVLEWQDAFEQLPRALAAFDLAFLPTLLLLDQHQKQRYDDLLK